MNPRRLGVAACVLAAAAGASIGQEPVREEVSVVRVEVTLHVTDRAGNVVPGLTKQDFRLFIDDVPEPIESVEWVGSGAAAPPEAGTSESGEKPAPATRPGRLIVLLFQLHIAGGKDEGLMRMQRQALDFIGTLDPADRVAVLAAGSRLWLRQDFTSDRKQIRAAVAAAFRHEDAPRPEAPPEDSLAAGLPVETEVRATSIEKVLAAIGNALRPLRGSKAVLFFGWGVGRWSALGEGAGNAHMGSVLYSREYEAAERALAEAQAPVFALDVSGGAHQLEAGLRTLAFETGGFYSPTHQFPGRAMRAVAEAIRGHYELVFQKPHRPRGPHTIRIELMRGSGRLLYRQQYDDSAP